jgi:hypothetical protein
VIEAAFPIDRVFPSYSVAYIGMNKNERANNEALMAQLIQLDALKKEYKPVQQTELEKRTSRYRIEHIRDMDIETAERISRMFSDRFAVYPTGLAQESIRKMPEDHIVTVAYAGEELSAVFMADRASVEINGKELTFFDFVNVLSKHDGLYLIPLMAHRVISIAHNYPNPVVYAEARADVPGLQVCCIRVGMIYAGTLGNSSIFQDRYETNQSYRNTHVWYVPM